MLLGFLRDLEPAEGLEPDPQQQARQEPWREVVGDRGAFFVFTGM
jgi:hypothetical protein